MIKFGSQIYRTSMWMSNFKHMTFYYWKDNLMILHSLVRIHLFMMKTPSCWIFFFIDLLTHDLNSVNLHLAVIWTLMIHLCCNFVHTMPAPFSWCANLVQLDHNFSNVIMNKEHLLPTLYFVLISHKLNGPMHYRLTQTRQKVHLQFVECFLPGII